MDQTAYKYTNYNPYKTICDEYPAQIAQLEAELQLLNARIETVETAREASAAERQKNYETFLAANKRLLELRDARSKVGYLAFMAEVLEALEEHGMYEDSPEEGPKFKNGTNEAVGKVQPLLDQLSEKADLDDQLKEQIAEVEEIINRSGYGDGVNPMLDQTFDVIDLIEMRVDYNDLHWKRKVKKAELDKAAKLNQKLEACLNEPYSELHRLVQRKRTVEQDVAKAEQIKLRLGGAANSYERKLIHDECAAAFGNDKPARVLDRLGKELGSINHTIVKLDRRLRELAARATRTVETIVIDGNNLCYQQREFVGLSALRPAAHTLAKNHAVVVVFDASIRSKLKMSNQDIAAELGDQVITHIVASKQKADETVLDAAAASTAFVVSNDRFGDFPEKAAVRDQRIIRHEILNGKIFIHELQVLEDLLCAEKA